jgi:hypothetical protein
MTPRTDTVQAIFISEEYNYLCRIVLLAEGTTVAQIEQWWQEGRGSYSDPLPGEARRADIIWKHDLKPENGWTPVDETWPHAGQVFHLLNRESQNYDPEEYIMPRGVAFAHIHTDEDSFLRIPDGTQIPHPDHDPSEDEDTNNPSLGSMLLWGMTSSRSILPTFNNIQTKGRN